MARKPRLKENGLDCRCYPCFLSRFIPCRIARDYFSVKAVIEKGNSDLVNIGVSVLRVDPEKEKQISEATREWALNLIDANAGGVTFSPEARAQLLKEPLKYSFDNGWGTYGFFPSYTPVEPAPPRPSPEPPK